LDQPYFDIATNYGFANYMFQTNEGPSFPAHQFIFGGTSAPVWPGDTFYQYFVAENATGGLNTSGCPATGSSGWPMWVDPDDNEGADQHSSECYDRNTLVTYQDSAGVVHDWTTAWSGTFSTQPAWKYYVPTQQNPGSINVVWNAPQDDPQICYFTSTGGGTACGSNNSTEYSTHVDVATNTNMKSAPILSDIQDCDLPAISWVIPDERWSDHPDQKQLKDLGTGPDWVAAIVDAIGQSAQNSNGVCDYWGTSTTAQRIEPTVVFIIWDDWGGFYDHVPPPAVYRGTDNVCTSGDAPNGWGCGYAYGFRVPLLVVSEYTAPGTISGAISGTPTYPPLKQWTHDFGSILAFTEKNFTNQGYNLPSIAPAPYSYADQNTLDALYNKIPVVPLWDFFLASKARPFTYINPLSSEHNASFFESYYQTEQPDGLPAPYGPEYGDED